jgi:hypothetical protein
MKDVPAIEEMREIKERHAAKYGYDIHKMVKALRRREAKSGHKLVSFAPRRTREQAGAR